MTQILTPYLKSLVEDPELRGMVDPMPAMILMPGNLPANPTAAAKLLAELLNRKTVILPSIPETPEERVLRTIAQKQMLAKAERTAKLIRAMMERPTRPTKMLMTGALKRNSGTWARLTVAEMPLKIATRRETSILNFTTARGRGPQEVDRTRVRLQLPSLRATTLRKATIAAMSSMRQDPSRTFVKLSNSTTVPRSR